MNINEHMNQLGQIGSVGYAPTEAVIDDLLSRTKRARAVRQTSAAVVGSVSAIALGVVGAQIYVTIDHRNDAATQDRNLIENGVPKIFDFDSQYGSGYTGMDEESKKAFEKIYEDLEIAAKIEAKHLAEKQAAEAAAAAAAAAKSGTTTTCVYEEHDWEGGIKYRSPETNCQWVYPDTPDKFYNPWTNAYETCTGDTAASHAGIGYYNCSTKKWVLEPSYFQFGNKEIYKCENWTDAATGTGFVGAISNKPVSGSFNGDWEGKRIYCQIGKTYTYVVGDYTYMGTSNLASWTGNVCTGVSKTKLNAPHQYSCATFEWTMTDPVNYKYLPDCGQYYDIRQPATWPENWSWNGSTWVYTEPTPDPTPTATTSTA